MRTASSPVLAGKISAMRTDGAFGAFRLAALAKRLPMLLQQQVGSLPRVKLFRNLRLDQRLRLAIGNANSSRAPAPIECAPALAGNSRPPPPPAAALPKSKIRSAPGSAMFGNFFSVFRTSSIGPPAHCGDRRQIHSRCVRRSAASRIALTSGTMPPAFSA